MIKKQTNHLRVDGGKAGKKQEKSQIFLFLLVDLFLCQE